MQSPSAELHLDSILPTLDGGRVAWRRRREAMEQGHAKHTPDGVRPNVGEAALEPLLRAFGRGLRVLGLQERGESNAAALRLNAFDLAFPDLPAALDGYRILHLTDLHVDENDATTSAAVDLVRGVDVDACVVTGDYRAMSSGPHEQIVPEMRRLLGAIHARDGVFGTLGNHDSADMVDTLESLGIRMLVNESVCISRGADRLSLTGLDDVHHYYTDAAREALVSSPEGFRVALVHSPEVADMAAEAGFRLYLAGHTHGGQICWPGGHPLITHLHRLRHYSRGLWRHGEMLGHTSTGAGVSGLPVRFHSRGEVALVTLRQGGWR